MYDLSITLFGTPQIKYGERPIALQRRKDLALFVYLAVTSQPHTRDTLAALFWPDSDQSDARANLRKNLSRLKNDLGKDFLLHSQDQVSLNPDHIHWIDVQQFQYLVNQPRKHSHILHGNGQPLCEDCQKALEEAVQLYRGNFLEGFSLPDSSTFEEWQFFQSEGYRQNLGEALQYLINQYIHSEDYNLAIELGRKWLAMDTLHEPAHRLLMLIYAKSGKQAAAQRQFDECVRLLREEVGVEPEPETVELLEAIRKKLISQSTGKRGSSPPSQKKKSHDKGVDDISQPAHNLPIHPTPFLGRTKELGEIKKFIKDPACRVLTLLGPGGSGKTRLATQMGFLVDADKTFRDGIFFIHLAPLTEQSSIIPTIQKEFNIPASGKKDDDRLQLLNYLSNKQILLILDNLEHLLNTETTTLFIDLINNAPQTKLLITSRERLNIRGETIFLVEGLETPSNESLLSLLETDSVTNRFGAIQLFVQSARRVQPTFQITKQNIGTISQICSYVQGMPLAIELAASWMEILPEEEIHKEIKQSLDFLQSELHDVPNRQRSLRAVFDSSWIKLNRQARSTIKALSVFRSYFSREAAQAITGASVKILLELTNKSWIQQQSNGKYQIHELLRQFAYEKLERDSVTFEQVKEQYCNYYGKYMSDLWEMMKGTKQSYVFQILGQEFENIKTAWGWLALKGDFEAAVNKILPVLFSYSEVSGKSSELMDMCYRMLDALKNSTDRSTNQNKTEIILRTAQGAFWDDGHPFRYEFYEAVYPFDHEGIRTAWALARKTLELHELGHWCILLAYIYGHTTNIEDAIDQLRQTLLYFQRESTSWELANAKLHLARLLLQSDSGTHEEIQQYLSEARDTFNSMGDKVNYGQTIRQMGNLRMKEQNITEAIHQWKVAHATLMAENIYNLAAASSLTWQIGDAYLQLGRFDEAFNCFQDISRVTLEHGLIQQAAGALSKESFEKSRYGDLEDAIRIRQKCIELIQRSGPEYQIGWGYWEMGELLRLADKQSEAEQWFDRSYEIFEKFKDYVGLSFYWRGKGDISLQNMEFEYARQNFEKSRRFAHQANHNWMTIYSLNGFGIAECELDNIKSSEKSLLEALVLARKVHDPGITLKVIAGIATFFARKGQIELSVVLGSLVLNHFASWNEVKTQANSLMTETKQTMLPREYNELKKKQQDLDLWQTVDQVIEELQ